MNSVSLTDQVLTDSRLGSYSYVGPDEDFYSSISI